MGCSLTIIRPEHRILDSCIEIGRLAALSSDDHTVSESMNGMSFSSSSASSSASSSSRDIEYHVKEEFCHITNVAKSCELLPQYCLREVRHAVETLHFRKPEIAQRLQKVTDSTITSVKQKTLGLSSAYSCFYSPNEGTLKLDFVKSQDKSNNNASPSRVSLIPPNTISPQAKSTASPTSPAPGSPAHFTFNNINPGSPTSNNNNNNGEKLQQYLYTLSNPSKTPSSSPRSTITAPPSPPPPLDHKTMSPTANDRTRRASCPPPPTTNLITVSPKSASSKKYERREVELPTNQRIRLRSLDESEPNVYIDYGFYHEDDHVFEC